MDGMDSDSADITDYYVGEVNSFEDAEGREWCDQYQVGEDSFYGDYYWETEYSGKYLHMGFWMQAVNWTKFNNMKEGDTE